jgi:hypothetical protein
MKENFYNYSKKKTPQSIEMEAAPRIRVVVRKRPLTQKELRKDDKDIIRVHNNQQMAVEELK